MKLSLTEENYLKAIYHLSQAGELEVSTNAIAEVMETKPASVSDMLRKLSAKKVVAYERYKGVNILPDGEDIALQVIRKHRLWEVFLVEKLAFSWDEVHEVAEQLEHIQSTTLIARLDKFLGYPTMDPHGDPIPDEQGNFKVIPQFPLAELIAGDQGMVVKVPDSNPSLLQHLDKIQMKLGSRITVLDKVEFDNSVLISIDNQNEIYLSGEIAKNIMLAVPS